MTFEVFRRFGRVRDGYWFVPRQFGFGATPVTWQGWLLTLGFCAALMLDTRFLPGIAPRIIVGLVLIVAFTTIAWRKTDGGWHWHWGSRE